MFFHVLLPLEQELSNSPLKAHGQKCFLHLLFTATHCGLIPGEHWEKGLLYTCIKCEAPEGRDNWSEGSRHPHFISLQCLQGSTGTWQPDQIVVWSLALERESSAWMKCLTSHLTSPETAASITFHESGTKN